MSDLDFARASRAVEDNPTDPQAWLRLGELLRARGEEARARDCFQRARTLSRAQSFPPPSAPTSSPPLAAAPLPPIQSGGAGQPASLFCPECGQPNPPSNRWCVKCGTALPQLAAPPAHPDRGWAAPRSAPAPQREAGSASWWQRLGPDWKAALIFGIGWAIVGLIYTATGGLGFVFAFPVQIVLGLLQGVVAARYASRGNRYTLSDYFMLGLRSGLWTVLIILAVTVLLYAAVMGITVGTALALLPAMIVATIVSILLQLSLPALSAWLYGRYGGKKLALVLTGAGCGCTVLIAALIALLGALGISLLNGG